MIRNVQPKLLATLTAGALLVTTISGCGSSTKAAAASTTSGTIKIGVIEPENTAIYNAPDEVAAAYAAAQGANAAGGIHGKTVKVVFCNNQDDPNATSACVRQMIAEKVVEVGPSIDVLGPQMVEELSAAGIPVVDEDANSLDEMTAKTAFPLNGGTEAAEAAEVDLAASKGLHKFFLVANAGSSVAPLATAIRDTVGDFHSQYVGNVEFPTSGVTDYSPYAQKIIASGADVVSLPLAIQQAVPLMQAIRTLGSKVQFIMNGGAFTPAIIHQNSALVNGLLIVNDVPPVTAATEAHFPEIAEYARQMSALAKTGDAAADISTDRAFSLRVWDVLQAEFSIMRGIKGAVTAGSFLAALNKAKNVSLGGILPAWNPTASLTIPGLGLTRYSEADYYSVEVENGTQVLLSTTPVNIVKFAHT